MLNIPYGVSEKSPPKKLPASAMEDTINVGTPFTGNDDENEKIEKIEKNEKSIVFKAFEYVKGAVFSDNRPKGVGYSSYAQKGFENSPQTLKKNRNDPEST